MDYNKLMLPIMMMLRKNGMNVDPAVLTIDQGFNEILKCLSGK